MSSARRHADRSRRASADISHLMRRRHADLSHFTLLELTPLASGLFSEMMEKRRLFIFPMALNKFLCLPCLPSPSAYRHVMRLLAALARSSREALRLSEL